MFTIEASLEAIVVLGCTPHGERRFVAIAGGIVKGRKLSGRIMPGGADWQIVRSDGTAEIHARYMIETERGARVLVDSQGLRRGPAEVLDRLARGEDVDPSTLLFSHRDAVRGCRSSTRLAEGNSRSGSRQT